MKKPTIEQIHEYMLTRGDYSLDEAEAFYDHYEMCGWVVTKARTPMKCYKAAIRNWFRQGRRFQSEQAQRRNTDHQSFADRQRQTAADAMQELERGNGEVNLRVVR